MSYSVIDGLVIRDYREGKMQGGGGRNPVAKSGVDYTLLA